MPRPQGRARSDEPDGSPTDTTPITDSPHCSTNGTAQVESVSRAAKILQAFQPHSPVLTVREIAVRTGLAKSSCHAICSTLTTHGFLETRPGGGYQLGWALAGLGGQVLERTGLVESASPWLERLSSVVGGEVHLGQYVHGNIIYLVRVRGDDRVRMPNRFGTPVPTHVTGAGWAVLSALPDDEVAAVVQHSRPARLREELARGRALGYVVYDSVRLGIRAVAAPIVSNGQVLGAISVAHLRARVDAERIATTGDHVLTAVQHIGQKLDSLPLPSLSWLHGQPQRSRPS